MSRVSTAGRLRVQSPSAELTTTMDRYPPGGARVPIIFVLVGQTRDHQRSTTPTGQTVTSPAMASASRQPARRADGSPGSSVTSSPCALSSLANGSLAGEFPHNAVTARSRLTVAVAEECHAAAALLTREYQGDYRRQAPLPRPCPASAPPANGSMEVR